MKKPVRVPGITSRRREHFTYGADARLEWLLALTLRHGGKQMGRTGLALFTARDGYVVGAGAPDLEPQIARWPRIELHGQATAPPLTPARTAVKQQ